MSTIIQGDKGEEKRGRKRERVVIIVLIFLGEKRGLWSHISPCYVYK